MENIQIITSSNFFVEQDPIMGTAVAEKFSSHIHSMGKTERENVNTFLAWKADGKKVDVSPAPRIDRNGKPYYWIGRGSSETSTGFKLPLFNGVQKLIDHSLDGVKINVSLDELMAIADSIIKSQKEQNDENQSTADSERNIDNPVQTN